MSATDTAAKETHAFQAETRQILQLVIHSLYSNKEIFLRELISNAADACDKLRFEALGNDALYEGDADLHVDIELDADAGTLTLRDNGIGMSREEVVENIGTIASSGTKRFLAQLSQDQAADRQLIGQFGVGFYSAFIVANRVQLTTRRAGAAADSAVRWESAGEGEYSLEGAGERPRGTEIVLWLRDDAKEFLERWKIEQLVHRYSEHINLPIRMLNEAEPAADPAADNADEDADKVTDVPQWETVNAATALWTQPKSSLKDEDYQAFYKHIAHDFDDPLLWSHNRVEGKLQYTSLLYIPKRAPFDLFSQEQQHGLKLYVQRVFIMDDADKLLPRYLRFVRGVVDSNDLPLNVSRELLQNNKVIESIRAGCSKRVLTALEQLADKQPEDYQRFWKEFGKVLKEGVVEDIGNKEQVAGLLRFASTRGEGAGQTTSLSDYLARMAVGQEQIYYVIADTHNAAANSPHLEIFRKKGIEVLLLSDRVDEWLVSHLTQFQDKKLVSVTRGGLDLDKINGAETPADAEEKDGQEASDEQNTALLERVKQALVNQVQDVKASKRLVDSPSCLVVGEFDMSRHMQDLLKEMGQDLPDSKPSLELNLSHPLVKKLNGLADEEFADWSDWLFQQALLAEGGTLDDPGAFIRRMNQMMLKAFSD